jgi:[acyl-carrier-protein] S-malonyltransferase
MKLAFVFPGQGSQSVGMMRGFAGSSEVRAVFEEASSALGQDLWTLVEEGPAEALNLTVNTQPAMLTAGYAVYRAWRAAGGPEPDLVAGHSLGEYTALVAAGALAFRDAVPLVRIRAQAMQEAVPIGEGAMAAILGLDDDALKAACSEAAQGQVVEAGQLQRAEPGGDRRAQDGSGTGDGGRENPRRKARHCAAGERAVSFVAAQAGGGPAGTASRGYRRE